MDIKTRRLTLDLPLECYKQVRFLSAVADVSMKEIIVVSVAKYMDDVRAGKIDTETFDGKAALDYFDKNEEFGKSEEVRYKKEAS